MQWQLIRMYLFAQYSVEILLLFFRTHADKVELWNGGKK